MFVAVVLGGCAQKLDALRWEVELADAHLAPRIVRVGVAIRRGGCAGEPVYESSFVPGEATDTSPPVLPAGAYGFSAEAWTATCSAVAEGCVEESLPRESVRVVLHVRLPSIERCGADACHDGVCGADVDAGRDPTVDAARVDAVQVDAGRTPVDAGSPDCSDLCPPGAVCSSGVCHYGTQSCPSGELAVGFSDTGVIQCGTVDAVALAAVHARCRFYYGWRDACADCATEPAKWGFASQDLCTDGAGTNNDCSVQTLGEDDVRMFGLNTEGDVDRNDKFYYGLHCTDGTPGTATRTGSCPAGQFITALNPDGSFACTAAEPGVVSYVRNDCRFYAGWIDTCWGCTTLPSRYGWVSHSSCASVEGASNNCTEYSLAGSPIWMFGLNTDGGPLGDVNHADKFHVGFYCNPVRDEPLTASACPAGQLATGVTGGDVICVETAARAADYVRESCWAYFGWRDRCTSCTTGPSKWGRVSSTDCENGTGANNTCVTYDISGTLLPMFGLNTEGDVGADDKFHLGLRCF